jgi:pimeloyl-ACP methyl ester carboxylesterase
MTGRLLRAALGGALLAVCSLAVVPAGAAGGINDPGCRSAAHPVPVVLLHGLGASKSEDIDEIQRQLAGLGYCTFATTYGAHEIAPFIGGVISVADSAKQIAAFVRVVLAETKAKKVDLVGHSEGAFQSLYVTKTQGISRRINRVVAIAPPTHGTTFAGLYDLAYVGGDRRALVDHLLHTFGCQACSDLGIGGAAVATLNKGPVAQPGVAYTILTSTFDELVTPTSTSFVHERGVANSYVQDVCPLDPVGHLGEAYDPNVWHLVENALDPAHAAPFSCLAGAPA